MKNIFWLLEDDAKWIWKVLGALVLVGVVIWGAQTYGISISFS